MALASSAWTTAHGKRRLILVEFGLLYFAISSFYWYQLRKSRGKMVKTLWRLRRDHGETKAMRAVKVEAKLEVRAKEAKDASRK